MVNNSHNVAFPPRLCLAVWRIAGHIVQKPALDGCGLQPDRELSRSSGRLSPKRQPQFTALILGGFAMTDAVKVGFVPFSGAPAGILVVFCGDGLEFGPATRKALDRKSVV